MTDLNPSTQATIAAASAPPTNLNGLTQSQLQALDDAQIALIAPAEIAKLDKVHLGWLLPSQVAALRPEQFVRLPTFQSLTMDCVPVISPEQITAITKSFAGFKAGWINALRADTLAAIDPAHITQLGSSVTPGLAPTTIAAMTPQQFAALSAPVTLSPAAVAAISPAQAAALTIRMSQWSADWINALSPEAIAAIPPAILEPLPAAEVARLSPASAAALTPAQIGVLDYASKLSPAAVAALRPEQTPAFAAWEWERMGVNTLSPAALAAIPVNVIEGLSASMTATLSASAVGGMTPAQIAALPAIVTLSSDAVAAITPHQIATLPLGSMSADWINALSSQTIGALSPAQIGSLSAAAIPGLNAATLSAMDIGQLTALPTPELLSPAAAAVLSAAQRPADWTQVTATWLNAQTAGTLAAIAPADLAQLSTSVIPALSADTIRALAPEQFRALPAYQTLSLSAVAAITPAQAATFSVKMNRWSADWINAMSSAAISAIPPTILEPLPAAEIARLSPASAAALTPGQILILDNVAYLSQAAVAALTPIQAPCFLPQEWDRLGLTALPPATLAAIPVSVIRNLSGSMAAKLTVSTVRAMTPAQLAVLPAIGSLTADALAALSPAQAAALTALGGVGPNWLDGLSPAALAAVSPKAIGTLSVSTVAGLSAALLATLSTDQLIALPSPQSLSPEAAAVRTAALGPWAAVVWSEASADWLNGMSPEMLASLPPGGLCGLSANTVQALLPATVAALSPAQVGALAHSELLSPAASAVLTAPQVAGIRGIWSSVGAAWLNALTPEAFAAIPPEAVAQLSSSAVGGLVPTAVAALTPAQVVAMTRFSSLGTSATAALTPDAIRAMTPEQIGQLGHADWLSPPAVAALTPEQVLSIRTGWSWMSGTWLNALSPEAISALPIAVLDALSTSALRSLSASAVGALTLDQLRAFSRIGNLGADGVAGLNADAIRVLSIEQIRALGYAERLSPSAAAALTSAQVAALPVDVWSKVGGAWISALAPEAFSALSLEVFSRLEGSAVRAFSAEVVAALSPEQFAALANIGWINPTAIGAIRVDQMRGVKDLDTVSAGWLNALSLETFAAIPAEGFNQMSLVALQGLDGAHRAIAQTKVDTIHAGYLAMASSDASINYDSVLTALGKMAPSIGADGLSFEQLGLINTLMTGATAVNGGATYVSSLLSSMLNEGMGIGTTSEQFAGLVDKWFLGLNNPSVRNGTSLIDVGDKVLFGGTTDMTAKDVSQGSIGDCGLISSLIELATVAPERLNGLIGANGNGTYAVKFYLSNVSTPFFITIDSKVADYGASAGSGAWARLLEDAYVEAITSKWGGTNNSMDALGGTSAFTAAKRLTGGGGQRFYSGAAAYDTVAELLRSGEGFVTYTSDNKNSEDANGKTMLCGSHSFSVIGINEANGNFIIRNPWSSSYTFEISAAELDATPGTGHFNVRRLVGEYGSDVAHTVTTASSTSAATDAGPGVTTATAQLAPTAGALSSQGDLSSLVQAMGSFDVAAPAGTALPSADPTRSGAPSLVAPH